MVGGWGDGQESPHGGGDISAKTKKKEGVFIYLGGKSISSRLKSNCKDPEGQCCQASMRINKCGRRRMSEVKVRLDEMRVVTNARLQCFRALGVQLLL